MKIAFCLVVFLFSVQARANTIFTSISGLDKKIFLGVKKQIPGELMTSSLWFFDTVKSSKHKISLPRELSKREIRFITPTDRNSILVLTQWTTEQGDEPLLHEYNIKTRKWKKLSKLKCINIEYIQTHLDHLELKCNDGKPISLSKFFQEFKLPGKKVYMLPQATWDGGAIKATLEGIPFDTEELKILIDKKESKFKAEDFIKSAK